MERIFEPKTNEEIELVNVIKTNPEKKERQKALKKLLVLNGFSKKELYAIRSIEYYDPIPNQPTYYKKFRMAIVMYNDTMLKR
jgi:hypothetical protein